MRRDVVCGAVALLLPGVLGAAAVAAAQTAQQEMVPLELVQTLMSGPFGQRTAPDVLVGRLPEALASRLTLPQESRVVGSVASQGHSASAIAVPSTPASARDAFAANLAAAGWRRMEPPERSGFQSNDYDPSLTFCQGDSVWLNVGTLPNPRGGSYVILTHRVSRDLSPCRLPEVRGFVRMRASPIPSLAPPAESITRGHGSGGGGDMWETRARIRTRLGVGELLDHYGAQLRQHGWTPLERTAADALAAESFRVTAGDGVVWHGVLVATMPAPDAERFISLRLTRADRRLPF